MKPSHVRRSGRRAFTLVELLIVIAIISVLLSLVSSAVWKAVVTGNRVKNRTEISQLETAMENFKQKFGIYPPSRIILCEQFDFYFQGNKRGNPPKSGLHADSITFLQAIWPRINFDFPNKPGLGSRWTGIDWNGDGQFTPPGEFLLEGDQCLVFFLGGIPGPDPKNPFCTGFSTNPANPAFHTISIGTEVIPPFFEFQSTRLIALPSQLRATYTDAVTKQPLPPVSTYHYSYRDAYGNAPYAYFSSYKTRNGYNRYPGASDCTSLGVWPYAERLTPTVSYLNPNTFQIISAGANGAIAGAKNMGFGRGTEPGNPKTIWNPAVAGRTEANRGYAPPPLETPPSQPPQLGLDDQSNFYDSTLGTPLAGS